MSNTKHLKEWLVGRTISSAEYIKNLNILAITLDDGSTLIIHTETFAKGLPQ